MLIEKTNIYDFINCTSCALLCLLDLISLFRSTFQCRKQAVNLMQQPPTASRWRHKVSFNDLIIFLLFIRLLLFEMLDGYFIIKSCILHNLLAVSFILFGSFYCVFLDKTWFRIRGARQLSPKYLNFPASFQMYSIPPWLSSTLSNQHISSFDCVRCTHHISGNGKTPEIIFNVYVFVSFSLFLLIFF